MTVLEVICKTVAMQNNSRWPGSMCPIPQFRLVGVRTSHIFNISWTPWRLDPITNPFLGGPWLYPLTRPESIKTCLLGSLSLEIGPNHGKLAQVALTQQVTEEWPSSLQVMSCNCLVACEVYLMCHDRIKELSRSFHVEQQ